MGNVYFSSKLHLIVQKSIVFISFIGANINAATSYGDSPLTLACELGFSEIIEFLVDNGADVKHENKEGLTALKIAIKRDRLDDAQLLISKGSLSHVINVSIAGGGYHAIIRITF